MPTEERVPCATCGMGLARKEIYQHQARQLCADCCMEARMPPSRKTHWQYLKSIKADYLRHPKKR